ncbi:AAA family ATPase [Anthocerotibacter panamensis]|uniref:AAA family ATPase n=1 Tax=Anthocerotibacter panamensis TaxID=2857077 RepID=UPI001FD96E0A|nr:AAA family ATPase [Anthocerotibacter panamensis]
MEFFKALDELVELAQRLEEKAQQEGGPKVQVQMNTRYSSIPRGAGIPRPSAPKPAPEPEVREAAMSATLQEIGGMEQTLQELRELVQIPLQHPELLAQLGLDPPRGVLLVGPPGTGKTLTARALAQDLGLHYIALIGPEVMGKFYGEAETRLREVFQRAEKAAPCLIFIDEIDALAPDRAKVEGEVEKRLVAQLLGLMDGFDPKAGVLVLGATNRPDHLDPALRRPGRFDREVVFRVPDRKGRLAILEVLTRKMPLATGVDLAQVADQTGGFVGADLKGLCQAAAYRALRRQVPDPDCIPPHPLQVSMADFTLALADQRPAVLRSVIQEHPNVPWTAIGGLEPLKQVLKEAVEGVLVNPELYAHTRAQAPRGILLTGPPGTGKTLLAKAVASEGKANFIGVNGPELLSRWVGASELAVRELFTKARQAAPCVIFIDEIDTLAPARGSYRGDSGVSDRVIGQLLTELDGLRPAHGLLLMAATNRADTLDPALLRSGRLDLHLEVGLPDTEARLAILRVHNQDRPLAGDVDLALWATQTQHWSGADLALLSNQAAVAAIRRCRREHGGRVAALFIEDRDFQQAHSELAGRLQP